MSLDEENEIIYSMEDYDNEMSSDNYMTNNEMTDNEVINNEKNHQYNNNNKADYHDELVENNKLKRSNTSRKKKIYSKKEDKIKVTITPRNKRKANPSSNSVYLSLTNDNKSSSPTRKRRKLNNDSADISTNKTVVKKKSLDSKTKKPTSIFQKGYISNQQNRQKSNLMKFSYNNEKTNRSIWSKFLHDKNGFEVIYYYNENNREEFINYNKSLYPFKYFILSQLDFYYTYILSYYMYNILYLSIKEGFPSLKYFIDENKFSFDMRTIKNIFIKKEGMSTYSSIQYSIYLKLIRLYRNNIHMLLFLYVYYCSETVFISNRLLCLYSINNIPFFFTDKNNYLYKLYVSQCKKTNEYISYYFNKSMEENHRKITNCSFTNINKNENDGKNSNDDNCISQLDDIDILTLSSYIHEGFDRIKIYEYLNFYSNEFDSILNEFTEFDSEYMNDILIADNRENFIEEEEEDENNNNSNDNDLNDISDENKINNNKNNNNINNNNNNIHRECSNLLNSNLLSSKKIDIDNVCRLLINSIPLIDKIVWPNNHYKHIKNILEYISKKNQSNSKV